MEFLHIRAAAAAALMLGLAAAPLSGEAQVAPAAPRRPAPMAQPVPAAPPPRATITQRELDAIGRHISRFWNVPLGMLTIENPVVTLRVQLGPEGTVRSVAVKDHARYQSDADFRGLTDSAVHAVRLASPLPLPPGLAEAFRELIIPFDARQPRGLGG